MDKFLIVVDMQNDFISGSLGSPEAQAVLPYVEHLMRQGDEILFTMDTHGDDYLQTPEGIGLPVTHCVQGTWGWQIPHSIRSLAPDAMVFEKNTFASLQLAHYLVQRHQQRAIAQIRLAGLCTDICVVSNALLLQAMLPQVNIIVESAACAGTTPENHASALNVLKSCLISVQ